MCKEGDKMKYLLTILLTVIIAQAGIVHPQLAEKLEALKANETIQVIVHMKAQANLWAMPKGTTKAENILYLKEFAAQDQADLLSYLEDKVIVEQTWWIFNGLMFTGQRNLVEAVAAREDVDYVIDNFNCYIHPINKGEEQEPLVPGWNITIVSGDLCWNDGFDGAGTILGNIDTGVEVGHPAFGGRWISGGWFDAINSQPNPYDDHGHGTHTMGSITGGDGNGPFADDIGVAPGANFIAAKG
jgi:bacillopeptidase F